MIIICSKTFIFDQKLFELKSAWCIQHLICFIGRISCDCDEFTFCYLISEYMILQILLCSCQLYVDL